jgi:NAD(P)-dependent dehydrogenase (short-subunit alcohol dehydrogenase family)
MQRLQNKVVIVTGAGSGIGRASALKFAAEGARVAAFDLNGETLDATVAQITEAGGQARGYTVDVTDAARVETSIARVRDEFGAIEGLFNVAGGSGRKYGDAPAHECTLDGWNATLQLNLTGTFLMCKFALEVMLRQGGGAIINLSSVLGLTGNADFATHAYAASKGAIISFSQAMAVYYAPRHIRVNVIAPGLIDTAMSQRAQHNPQVMAMLPRLQPLTGTLGSAEDVAAAAVFLASDDARFITGVVLPVDGGWTAQ